MYTQKKVDNECLLKWLEIYYSTKNADMKAAMKNSIVTHMIPVVKNIAHTIARRATDPIEDLIQAGFVGLLKAIERYASHKNSNFKVYAGYFIIGEMRHYLRDRLTAIRVPAHVQELIIRINHFTRNLTYDEVQQLTSNDVADALHVPAKAVEHVLLTERRCTTISLDYLYSSDSSSDARISYEEFLTDGDYKEQIDSADMKIMMGEIFKILPEKDKQILDMYCNQDLNQKEIAKELGISEMKVSRAMKNIFKKVYNYFDKIQPINL